MNVSERGGGILTRETHREGERVTVTFTVPGDPEPVTASGEVRWSSLTPSAGRWHATGIEWLPLEEGTKSRLHRFLYQQPKRRAPSGPSSGERRVAPAIGWIFAATFSVALLAGIAVFWLLSLHEENQALGQAIEQRNLLIAHLESQETRLARELETSKAHLAASAGEVARLDQQAQMLGGRITQLTGEVGRFQRSYDEVRSERERLMKQVLDLQQERAKLGKRWASLPDLRVAIREAMDARRVTEREQRRMIIEARRQAEREALVNGNRGYLTREGRPTISKDTIFIRVHDLDAAASPQENGG